MDLLLILTYTGLCIAIFKIFRIPLNKWSVPTAILGGIVLIGTLLLLMNYNHPYGKYAREVFATVPIVPAVRGHVVAVDVTPNQPVRQGDVLFRIDPVPYQLKVEQLQAELAEVRQGTRQTDAQLDNAEAQYKRALADRDRARQNYQRYVDGNRGGKGVFSRKDVENRRQLYLAAQASAEAARANLNKARYATESTIDGTDTRVVQLLKQLEAAEYDLERTVVTAPSDGVVTQLALRPGVMATTLPMRPAMVFIPTQQRMIAGSFWQNSLGRMEPGLEAEVILDALPGRVFSGKVVSVLPAMSEAQYQASGTLLSARELSIHGRAIAMIQLDEDITALNLPLGVQGKTAVYTDHFAHVAVMRKILLRMMGWLNYVYPLK